MTTTLLEPIKNENEEIENIIIPKIKQQPTLLITYLGEPIEICERTSCQYHEYLAFRSAIVKKIYHEMVEKFGVIFKLDVKKNKVRIEITWQSKNFNKNLNIFEFDIEAIKNSIREALFVSNVLSRNDKYFKNGNGREEDFITIKRVLQDSSECKKDLFIMSVYFEVNNNGKKK